MSVKEESPPRPEIVWAVNTFDRLELSLFFSVAAYVVDVVFVFSAVSDVSVFVCEDCCELLDCGI